MSLAEQSNLARAGHRRGRSTLRTLGVNFAHLAALSAFAVAQPLFNLLGESPDFFAVRGSSRWDIVFFALIVVLAPPAILVAVEALVGLVSGSAQRVLHVVFVAAAVAAITMQVLTRSAGLTSTATIVALAALAGIGIAILYRRVALTRSFLNILALAPVFFLGYFLLVSPVAQLTLAREPDVPLLQLRAEAPVVMVVFDELPISSLMDENGEIDRVRYPNFAELAADSTWFRNTSTVSYSTTKAVPAMLTGLRPSEGAPVFASHPRNLFTLLGGDYQINAMETLTRLCPRVVCEEHPAAAARVEPASLYSDASIVYLHLLTPPRVEESLPPITQEWMNFGREDDAAGKLLEEALAETDTERPRRPDAYHAAHTRLFRQFVRSIQPTEGPSLNFTHILFPHQPWSHFPSGKQSAIGNVPTQGLDGDAYRWTEPVLMHQAYQRHLLQVGFVDRLVGDLLDRLRETELYERSLVVVTADHGISFRLGEPQRDPTAATLPDIALVPLIVKQPGQREGEVINHHVEITDVLPTIADVLGIRLPWRIDGRSAFQDANRSTVRIERRKEPGELVAPFAAVRDGQADSLRRKVELFGAGDWELVFDVDPHADLRGSPVTMLNVAGSVDDRAEIHDQPTRRLLMDMDAGVPYVPSPLQGSVTGDGARAGRTLAVAVNDRIAALATTYGAGSDVRFSALTPESAFSEGGNSLTFFWVDGPAGAERLTRLAFE